MTQLGADPDDLRSLSRSLRSAAGRLDDLSVGLTRSIRAAGWRGSDAAAFDHQWQGRHRPALHAAGSGLAEMARRADRQAAAQVRASSAGSSAAGAALGRGATPPTAAGSDSMLPIFARVEDRYAGGVDVRVGPVVATISGDVTVQQLADGRRRVQVAELTAGGAVVMTGSSVDVGLGGPNGAGATTSGVAADARVQAGILRRRTWEVGEDRVDDLLARLALEHAGATTIGVDDPLVLLGGVVDEVAERVTGHDPGLDAAAIALTGVPVALSTEELTEVQVAGSAGVGLSSITGIGGRAHGVAAVRMGTVDGAAGRSSVIELQGSATGALTSTLLGRLGVTLPAEVHGGVAVRLEVPEPTSASPSPRHLLVRASVAGDRRVDDVVARVDLGGPSAAASIRGLDDALHAMRRGDIAGATASMARVELDPERITVGSATATVSGQSGRAGASTGVGVGGGLTLRGAAVHLERG